MNGEWLIAKTSLHEMKRVLITGANSYLGTNLIRYAKKRYNDQLKISEIDMIDGSWHNKNFSEYDIVYHVAGIAHADVDKASEDTRKKYYSVNTDLAIDTCKKAKEEGVKQFIFMSSIIVYGDSAQYGKKRRVTRDTKPNPSNFYGDSKWQADKAIREMSDDSFTVTILRPPMIYGKGSRGNYSMLSKLAKRLPIFPDVQNERSMLYIENFCEFLCQIMIRGDGGVFFPQNAEYITTSDLVRRIGEANGHKVRTSRMFNWLIRLASHTPGKIGKLTQKAFGSLSYDQDMSKYAFEYQLVTFDESIKRTEGKGHWKKGTDV